MRYALAFLYFVPLLLKLYLIKFVEIADQHELRLTLDENHASGKKIK